MWDNDGNSSYSSPLKKQLLPDSATEQALLRSGVPKRYLKARFSKIPETVRYGDSVKSYIKSLPGHLSSGLGLILTGPYGTGKTAASVLVLRELVRRI